MRATLLAIDPGEKHCGVAFFVDGRVEWTKEYSQEGLLDWLERHRVASGDLFEVVLEEFRLYPWKAETQIWSQMLTCECIGAVKLLCRQKGWPLTMARTASKKPTFSIMKSRGVKLIGKTQHEKDAEAHAYYRSQQRAMRG